MPSKFSTLDTESERRGDDHAVAVMRRRPFTLTFVRPFRFSNRRPKLKRLLVHPISCKAHIMKRPLPFVLLVSALCFAHVVPASPGDSEFLAFLRQWDEAQARFLTGDPTLWKQNASQREDATILGGFGGFEKGWAEIGPRYDWASSQYKESGAKLKTEYISTIVSGDLAFTVAIERQQEVRLGGQGTPTQRALRATQIFRKEEGAWKLLHRHADPLTEKKSPAAGAEK